jgi:hypothetical protein
MHVWLSDKRVKSMPEGLDSAPENGDEDNQKRIAFYQEMVSGWVTTQIEADKQAMGLSGLAVGLLVTLGGSVFDRLSCIIWFIAGLAFFGSIATGLRVLYLNARYIEQVLAENNPSEEERVLKRVTRYTLWVYGLFFLGAAFTAILAVISTPVIQNGDFFP